MIRKQITMVKVSKILVCGMKGVGKTALIEQLVYGNITKDNVSGQSSEYRVILVADSM